MNSFPRVKPGPVVAPLSGGRDLCHLNAGAEPRNSRIKPQPRAADGFVSLVLLSFPILVPIQRRFQWVPWFYQTFDFLFFSPLSSQMGRGSKGRYRCSRFIINFSDWETRDDDTVR